MKITTKTTKEQLKAILGANVKAVQKEDKDLFDRIAYADKVSKKDDSKVTRKDLVDLVKDVIALLGDKLIEPSLQPVAENSTKKLSKGVSKKQTAKEESSEEVSESDETADEQTEEKVDSKKSAKKSLGGKKTRKKSAPKKDGVTVLNPENDKAVQLAKMFPQTIEVGDSKYELASDIESMDDLYEALNNDEEIVFAFYWTKRHLKQFPYFDGHLGQPKSFDNDLDIAMAIYVSDDKVVSYQISQYTEACYMVKPESIPEEDGIRMSNGIEYQIYRAV